MIDDVDNDVCRQPHVKIIPWSGHIFRLKSRSNCDVPRDLPECGA